MELSAPLLALIGTALLAIGGLLGVLVNARLKREENMYGRLAAVEQKNVVLEEKEAECRAEVWDLKQDMSTLLLANAILIKEVPNGDEKLREVLASLTERRKKMMDFKFPDLGRSGDAERVHETQRPDRDDR